MKSNDKILSFTNGNVTVLRREHFQAARITSEGD